MRGAATFGNKAVYSRASMMQKRVENGRSAVLGVGRKAEDAAVNREEKILQSW